MNAVLFDTNTKCILNIVTSAKFVKNKVVYAEKTTLDYSNEQNIDCILTKNNFNVGDVLPEQIIEPISDKERIEQLERENALLKAQKQALSEQVDFHEELIVELATQIYA